MSKLLINALFDLPKDQYPIEETISLKYVVGYYVGTSFRVLCRCDSLSSAQEIARTYKIEANRQTFVYRALVNIQLM